MLPSGISAEEMAEDVFRRLQRKRPTNDLRLLKERCASFAAGMNRMIRQFGSVAGRELRPRLDQLERIGNEIVQNALDADGQFRLYVVGPGKSGKSSTINALVNAHVAEVKVTPCTWRVDVYARRNGQCSIHDFRGNVRFGSAKEIAGIIAADEKKRRESECLVRDEFRRRRENLDLPARLELKEQLRRDHLYQSPYIEARWNIVENPTIDGIWLVDTPGLNQEDPMGGDAIHRREIIDQRAREYYSRADGVLWILDAQVIASAGSRNALDDIQRAFEDLGGIAGNVIGVLNRIDLVRNDMGDDAVDRVLDDARGRFDGLFSKIVAFSAYDARPDASPAERERSGLATLYECIDRHFRQRAGDLRFEARSNGQASYERSAIDIAGKYAAQLSIDADDYKRRKDLILKARDEAVASVVAIADQWASRHLLRIEKNISEKFLKIWDIEKPNGAVNYLNNEVIETPQVDAAYQGMLAEICRVRERLADAHEKTACFCEYKYLDYVRATAAIPPYSGKSPAQQTFSIDIPNEPGIFRELSRGWEWAFSGKRNALLAQVREAFDINVASAKAWGNAIVVDVCQSMLLQLDRSFSDVHLPVSKARAFSRRFEALETLSRRPPRYSGAPGLLIGRSKSLAISTKELFAS